MSENQKSKKLKGKHILIGITGGIAAYKSLTLIRYFKKLEADVKVIMTPASNSFITPLSVSTLSRNSVYCEQIDSSTGEWVNHVELALWADVFVIAPLTANTLSKMVSGLADNLLLTTYLSVKSPVIVAPAMDLDMFQHPTTKRNIELLEKDGVIVLEPNSGFLASGLHGKGRMEEPEEIGDFVANFILSTNDFSQKEILITAGPTHENIDPVRFIGNSSSGKMGFEIARQFLLRGAKVNLISGPTNQLLSHPNLNRIDVITANAMFQEVKSIWAKCQIGVFAAAVADYRPTNEAIQKIKKKSDTLTLELTKNPDILKWAGENKQHQFLVGFALETNDALKNGKEKLSKKNLDAIVINSLEDKNSGFGFDTNKVIIVGRDNKMLNFELKSKDLVAKDIVDYIHENYEK